MYFHLKLRPSCKVVGTRALPLMGAGAMVSGGAALSCLASDFPAVQAFGWALQLATC
jgi:hypothetical protein